MPILTSNMSLTYNRFGMFIHSSIPSELLMALLDIHAKRLFQCVLLNRCHECSENKEVHPQKFHHYLITSLYQYHIPEIMDSPNNKEHLNLTNELLYNLITLMLSSNKCFALQCSDYRGII